MGSSGTTPWDNPALVRVAQVVSPWDVWSSLRRFFGQPGGAVKLILEVKPPLLGNRRGQPPDWLWVSWVAG